MRCSNRLMLCAVQASSAVGKGTHAHARERASATLPVLDKLHIDHRFARSFIFYLQVEWSKNSSFGR